MGIDITIGNLYITSENDELFDEECGPKYNIKRIDNNLITNPPSVENKNYFTTMYLDWDNLTNLLGKKYFFSSSENEVIKLDKSHLECIKDIINNFTHNHPRIVSRRNQILLNVLDEDRMYFRLLWMKYWIEWSLQNCEFPGMYIR